MGEDLHADIGSVNDIYHLAAQCIYLHNAFQDHLPRYA